MAWTKKCKCTLLWTLFWTFASIIAIKLFLSQELLYKDFRSFWSLHVIEWTSPLFTLNQMKYLVDMHIFFLSSVQLFWAFLVISKQEYFRVGPIDSIPGPWTKIVKVTLVKILFWSTLFYIFFSSFFQI